MTEAEKWRLANFVRQYESTISNALFNHADRMEAAAKEARAHYEAGQADPAVKAEQDGSLVTNAGLRMSAEMFEQEAAKARRVVQEMNQALGGCEDVED